MRVRLICTLFVITFSELLVITLPSNQTTTRRRPVLPPDWNEDRSFNLGDLAPVTPTTKTKKLKTTKKTDKKQKKKKKSKPKSSSCAAFVTIWTVITTLL